MAEEGEEARNGEGLVAVAQDFKVDGVAVVEVGEEGDGGVDGHHQQDADDVFLLPWPEVVRGVAKDEVEGYEEREAAEDCGKEEAEVVEGVTFPQRFFVNPLLGERRVAGEVHHARFWLRQSCEIAALLAGYAAVRIRLEISI